MITDEEVRSVLEQLGEICANNFLPDEPPVEIHISQDSVYAVILSHPPRIVSV